MMLSSQLYGNPSKPVVLFLHGFMGAGKDWQFICKRLQLHYACLTIDLPGHGASVSWEADKWDIASTAAACIEVLDKDGIEECLLTGYSMGGRVALYLAVHYPSRFRGVILESASPGLAEAKERDERRVVDNARADALIEGGVEDFLESWYKMPLFAKTLSESQIETLQQKRCENNAPALARSLRELGTGTQPSLWQNLAEINLPLFLFVGEKDAKFKQIAEEMQRLNSEFSLSVFSNCGHNCHYENADLFEATLRMVLKTTFE